MTKVPFNRRGGFARVLTIGGIIVAALGITPAVAASAEVVEPRAACFSHLHPSVRGGEAEWTVRCSGAVAWVDGWVKDTLPDGKSAVVKFIWPGGEIWYSPRAAGFNTRADFVSPFFVGEGVKGYLMVTG